MIQGRGYEAYSPKEAKKEHKDESKEDAKIQLMRKWRKILRFLWLPM